VKRRAELAGGEGVEGAEAGGEFGGSQAALAVEAAGTRGQTEGFLILAWMRFVLLIMIGGFQSKGNFPSVPTPPSVKERHVSSSADCRPLSLVMPENAP